LSDSATPERARRVTWALVRRRPWIAVVVLALLAGGGAFAYKESQVNSPSPPHQSAKGLAQEGISAFQAGQYDLAHSIFSQELTAAGRSANDRAIAYYNLGSVEVRTHQVSQGITDFQRAVALAPKFALAWMNLGIAEGSKGRTALAMRAYTKLLSLDPQNALGLFNSGLILYREGQHALGVSRMNEAISLDAALSASVPAGVNLG
jgi:tetratricopeptide (TPR) repeat protein